MSLRGSVSQTDNDWDNRQNFVKSPRGFFPLELDYSSTDAGPSSIVSGSKSKLPVPVKDLVGDSFLLGSHVTSVQIQLIFNLDLFKSTLKELEIDVSKMPLGKLSRRYSLPASLHLSSTLAATWRVHMKCSIGCKVY